MNKKRGKLERDSLNRVKSSLVAQNGIGKRTDSK